MELVKYEEAAESRSLQKSQADLATVENVTILQAGLCQNYNPGSKWSH